MVATYRRNVHRMPAQPAPENARPVLTLQFEVLDGHDDWPVVKILVDGRNPFADVAPNWRGFDPAQILGLDSVLLPDDRGRRVAVYRCLCGIAGCGVIAPVIVSSPDGERVSWVDFRDYVGVFDGPTEPSVDQDDGRPWAIEDLHFDREQYTGEIERASRDRSWETTRRRTARLLRERLEPLDLLIEPDLRLEWISPAWSDEGVSISFAAVGGDGPRQQTLKLTSSFEDPEQAAEDMTTRLLATPPQEWSRVYGVPL